MESTKQEIIIVKNSNENFNWSGYQGSTKNSRKVLYDSEDEKFNVTSTESFTEDICLNDISSSMQLSFLEGQNSIELVSTHSRITRCSTHFLRMSLEDALVKKLLSLLLEPVISIQFMIDDRFPCQSDTLVLVLDKLKPGEKFDTALQTMKESENHGIAWGTFTYSVVLEWRTPSTKKNQCDILEKLWCDKTLADCCILTGEQSEIKCHSSILAVNSNVFHAMLTSGLKESQTNMIELTDLSDNVVNELLSYLYGQEIKISQMKHTIAFDLLRAAHKYNIISLEHDMTETLLNKADASYEIDIVLALYYFTVNIEEMHALCDKAVNILKRNPEDLESSSAYRDLMEKDPKEAAKLAFKLLKLVSN